MKLNKVILKNFKKHKDLIFEPKASGIISISGNNGSGKTTILEGISWCLFRIKRIKFFK